MPDLNVLLYAVNDRSVHHDEARRWIEAALNGAETVGFAWLVLVGFLRLTTKAALFEQPLTVTAAVSVLRDWLACPVAVALEPGVGQLGRIELLLGPIGTAGNLTNDAHLAALALDHGARVVTFDRDFQRFAGLPVELLGSGGGSR